MEKTGFNYLDELSESERKQAFKNAREFWMSLTPEERTRYLDRYYTAIREKMKSKKGDSGLIITQEQAIREIINVDIPKIMERAIKEFEEHGRFDIAQDLRRRRLGVDTFAFKFNEQEEEEEEGKKKG